MSSPQLAGPQVSLQTTAVGQPAANLLQKSAYSMPGIMPGASPAVITMGSLGPLPTTAAAMANGSFSALNASNTTAGGNFPSMSASHATAGAAFPTMGTSSTTTAAGSFPTLTGSAATAGAVYTTSRIPLGRPRVLHKQLSTGTQHSQLLGMSSATQTNAGLLSNPDARNTSLMFPAAVANPMGSIASLVSAGLLPQTSGVLPQALPQGSLGHLAALLDLPHGNQSSTVMMPTSVPY